MKLKQLQHDLIVRLLLCAAVIMVVGLGIYYLKVQLHQQEDKYSLVKSDLTSVTRKLEGLNRRTIEFSDAVRIWDAMRDDQKQLQGLQLTKAKALLEAWQSQFKLSEVNISFSKPEDVQDATVQDAGKNIKEHTGTTEGGADQSGLVNIVSSDVTISFKALSDEYVYDFIYALQHQFPGYIRIKTFTLTQETPVTKEVIERIAQGETPPVVSGNIDFSWRDLKYTPAQGSDNTKTGEGI